MVGLIIGRRTQAYLHDVAMTGLSFAGAVGLVLPRTAVLEAPEYYAGWTGGTTAMAAIALLGLGLYRGIWRFASVPDLLRILRASTLLSVLLATAIMVTGQADALPLALVSAFWFIHIIALGGPRFAYRLMKDRHFLPRNMAGAEAADILVCGTDATAASFIRTIRAEPHPSYNVVGIIDRAGEERGRSLHGVPVLGTIHDIAPVVEQLAKQGRRPQRLALSMAWARYADLNLTDVLAQAEQHGLTLARLPDPAQLEEAPLAESRSLKPIAVEDLLGRPQAELDRNAIISLAKDRCVLVTGAGGTIGGELTRQIAALGPRELVMLDNGEFNLYQIDQQIREMSPSFPFEAVICDVRDRAALLRVFQTYKPELVLHAAALKHVPLVEANPPEGVLTNIIGTRNVADACRTVGTATMVMISTDKAIRPTNIMGATKRVAELYCQAVDLLGASPGMTPTRYVAVRFGNVLGSSGSVVPLFRRQLAAGGPLTVTHPEMRRYFMTVREAVELVLQSAAYGVRHAEDRGRVFVLDMGEPMRIVDLARQMIRLAGLRPDEDVKIEFTGLRPGEKLFEEIFDPEEQTTRTEADGVFIASPRTMDAQLLVRALDEIETAARNADVNRIRVILSNLVPGFHHEVKNPVENVLGAGSD